MGMKVMDQNLIHRVIKYGRNFHTAYCHSVQNLLSSQVLTRDPNMKTHKTISFFLYFCLSGKVGLPY
jgi:hypothetical protein